MAPKFGTSGLRGLVVDLTPDLVTAHVQAFVAACSVGSGLYVGEDLRPSSPGLAGAVAKAARIAGIPVTMCGPVPTPALAVAAGQAGAGAVMVTGSHIPADRNGLKFYTPAGEISKEDEAGILAQLPLIRAYSGALAPLAEADVATPYVARYVTAFGPDALTGLTVGVYSHSSVGRDLLIRILTGLGAAVQELGRSEVFIPVDTEAVDPDTRAQLKTWAAGGAFDAIVSMDGDADRPMLADATGALVPGDIMGQITAAALGAEVVVTPVSSNTGVDGQGMQVIRTRIGSPHVIAGMLGAQGKVVGYEANGGFLLGFAAKGVAGPLPPLMTRDAVLPLIATLIAGKGQGVAARVAAEPPRVTAADRLQEAPTETSQRLVAALTADPVPLLAVFGAAGATRDLTDGLRLTLPDGRVVHLRPSGNAPELRLYVEAGTRGEAEAALAQGLAFLRKTLG